MDTAASPPPPGVVADFNAPNPLYKWNILCQAVCLTTSSVAIGLRLYTKIRIVGTMRLGLEDWTCFVSWLMLLGYGTMASIFGTKYGAGQHIWNLTKETAEGNLRFNNDLEIVYGPTILFAKVSLLILYAKVFVPQRKGFTWWSIHSLLWFIILFYISVTITKIFECIPRSKIWVKSEKGKCIDNGKLLIVTGSINLATDIFLLILPMYKVWGLQLSQERRFGLLAIFALGSLAPVATILRLEESIRYESEEDATYAFFGILLWTVAEVTTGIICSSLPILPAFFRHFYPKIRNRLTAYSIRTPVTSSFAKGSNASNARAGNIIHSGGYLELDEMGNTGKQPVISTAISGNLQGWDEVSGSGILKSVRISQVRENI